MKKNLLTVLASFAFFYSESQTLPDVKTGVSFSYGYNQNNKEINLTWDFFNVGGATSNSFSIAYIASLDMNIGPEDYLIGSKAYGSAVANAFATVTFTYGFDAGDLPSGLYNFIVYLDYGNKIAESNENNNIISFGTFNFVGVATDTKSNSETNFDFSVYPNPATNSVRLQLGETKVNDNLKYILLDINSKEVLQGNFPEINATENKTLSLENLQKGMYFLRLESEGKILHEKKLIVN